MPPPRAPRAVPGTPRSPLDLRSFLPYRFHLLASRMAEAGASLSMLVHGESPDLSLRDWRVLAVIGAAGPLASAQIARLTAMDAATVARAVQSLKARGLVLTRSSTRDRRLVIVALSQRGAHLHDNVAEHRIATGRRIEECLTAAEREQLLNMLDRLDQRLDQLGEVAPEDGEWSG